LSSGAMDAAPAAGNGPLHAVLNVGKTIKFSLRNDTKVSMKVMAGETEITLAPGKSVSVKLATGTKIVSEQATETVPAGSVLTVVTNALDDATLAIK
jgi:hypothetical protein